MSFAVAFESDGLYFNAPERFVWRQGNGIIRWDILTPQAGEPHMGWISLETNNSSAEALEYKAMGCVWHRQASLGADGTPQARVSCSESGTVESGVPELYQLMSSLSNERRPDQTIAGREASCYSFDDPTLSVALFCVDSSDGIPLRLSTVGPPEYRLTQEMRAVYVSTDQQQLRFPIQLERHPVTRLWQFEGMVPLSTLDLPDLSQFAE